MTDILAITYRPGAMVRPNSPWTQAVMRRVLERAITVLESRCLVALASFQLPDGCYPSHAAIPERASALYPGTSVSTKTVIRALFRARALGLLQWIPRYHRADKHHWQGQRSSNRYFLITPDDSAELPPAPPRTWPKPPAAPHDGQDWARKEKAKKSQEDAREMELRNMLREAAAGPDLLALAMQTSAGRIQSLLQQSRIAAEARYRAAIRGK